MSGIICGTGSFVPKKIRTNDEIAQLVDTSHEWIHSRTGISQRRIAEEETVASMAAQAARLALKNGGVQPEEVDLLIVSTISSEMILPCAACEVQKELGAYRAACFDLNAACTGFVTAYNTAMAYLNAGICRTALIIGSECLSHLTNWQDRGTCILFGDGAGAVVLRAADTVMYQPVAHSDGSLGGALTCRSRQDGRYTSCEARKDSLSVTNTHGETNNRGEYHSSEEYLMQMDGQAIFKFAVRKVPEVIREVLSRNQLKQEEVTWYFLHQANLRIVEAVARHMGEPMDKFPVNMQNYGNTSSASIPILLDEMNRGGMLAPGQKIIFAGFGAGLTWGASIACWTREKMEKK